MPHLTPRWILQYWGTDVCRKTFHDDIWIASLENKLRNSRDDVVISDCRFPNEIKSIRRAGGMVVRVIRGPEPDWYDHAVNFNAGPRQVGWSIGKEMLDRLRVHPSEYSWIGTKFDAVLDNNGTLDHLYSQVKNLASSPLVAK